ncbi:unnamed protein product [Moneuplotes crassus]|uniref:DUF5745 domain-containing protein n=1 Tax=Euplotes crassus TaxID=5936 RepID=A0AAD2D9W6_EUPCR|nr:unnamed protein product [Moneuplotes crassus]
MKKYASKGTNSFKTQLKSEATPERSLLSSDFKKTVLNKEKELIYMTNEICKACRIKDIKAVKKLADDEFYIEIFEKEFEEIDFHDLKGAQSEEQKVENLQIMIDFLGNAIYEMDLSHIEPLEIMNKNYDHIHRFVKLLYEWFTTQAGVDDSKPVSKMINMASMGTMPTVDTYENIKSQAEDHGEIIDFYKRGRSKFKNESSLKGTSKFRILSKDKCENTEIFQNIVSTSETPTIRSSLTTSVNTTVLGGAVEQEEERQNYEFLEMAQNNESSYEISVEKGIIRDQFQNYEKRFISPEMEFGKEDTFATIFKIVEESKRKPSKNTRVKSFSPVDKTKDSFGLYYDQQSPDSSVNRLRNKPMTYFSKKNLKHYEIRDTSSDNKLKKSLPIYDSSKAALSSSSSKGLLTTSIYSNNERKEIPVKKKSHLMKWTTSQIKYKSKKTNDSNMKSSHSKFSTNYSTKRPKSAKGTGIVGNPEYIYKYNYTKIPSKSKYPSSSQKRKDTSQQKKNNGTKEITSRQKQEYMPSSYRKSNISGTHKKYAKTSRGVKKSNISSSQLLEQGNNTSRTSKFASKDQMQSYNSIMTMLMSKEKDMYRTTNDVRAMKHKTSKESGYHLKSSNSSSNSKLFGSSSRKALEVHSYNPSKEVKNYKKSSVNLYTNKAGGRELEDYLKTTRSRGSRNYIPHNSNAHVVKTYH